MSEKKITIPVKQRIKNIWDASAGFIKELFLPCRETLEGMADVWKEVVVKKAFIPKPLALNEMPKEMPRPSEEDYQSPVTLTCNPPPEYHVAAADFEKINFAVDNMVNKTDQNDIVLEDRKTQMSFSKYPRYVIDKPPVDRYEVIVADSEGKALYVGQYEDNEAEIASKKLLSDVVRFSVEYKKLAKQKEDRGAERELENDDIVPRRFMNKAEQLEMNGYENI